LDHHVLGRCLLPKTHKPVPIVIAPVGLIWRGVDFRCDRTVDRSTGVGIVETESTRPSSEVLGRGLLAKAH